MANRTTVVGRTLASVNGFKWTADMIQNLLEGLYEYKSEMEYRNCDFNADKAQQYEALRSCMAVKYSYDKTMFGPEKITAKTESCNQEEYAKLCEEETAMIKKGYGRVHEKIQELRQGFSKAVVQGTRSGSGKMVIEFYDLMIQIWGGSPASEPLPFWIMSAAEEQGNEQETARFENEQDAESNEIQDSVSVTEDASTPLSRVSNNISCQKRKAIPNAIPNLIDNKRKHMERQLSAAQRDKSLMQDSREEKEFRQTLTRTLQESNANFAEAMKAMSTSMVALSQSLQRSTEMMSQEQIASQFLNRYQHYPHVYQHEHYVNHQEMGMMGRQAKRNQEEDESDIYEFT